MMKDLKETHEFKFEPIFNGNTSNFVKNLNIDKNSIEINVMNNQMYKYG
jgi:hypothetical protein